MPIMKKLLNNSLFLLVFAAVFFACSNKESERKTELHYCPMHPTVKSNGPGICPICNMDLVAMDGVMEAGELGAAAVNAAPVSEKIISKAKTIRGRYHEGGGVIAAEAWVDVDRRNTKSISTFYSGRVESAEARYPFQRVTKGQILLTVYSPELVEAQRNHLLALKSSDGTFTRKTLLTLGMEESMIKSIETSGEPMRVVPVRSPMTGILIAAETETKSGGSPFGDNGMKEASEKMDYTSEKNEFIRPGEILRAGATVYSIAPSDDLRVFINIPASTIGLVKEGDRVSLRFPDGKEVVTKIESIEGLTDKNQDFIRAKTSVNLKNIQPGTILKAEIAADKKRGLWIPKSAALWLGKKNVVFIRDGNGFAAREIEIGQASQDSLLIKKGLSSMDEIATHAGMLQDGDTFIKN